ncbi:C2H2-type zinc finger protein [Candidatus Sororendozoicomonas aggregata]|uniref:C2H2-type zinc finger protein n=1 Tax=Candidatus Sororendozoicomonas aggregata TaxID=3073239 RepID=UPI002ED256C0
MPYKCEPCGITFRYLSWYTKHLRSHTGERPFKCPHCTSSFKESHHLSRHVKKHTGEKPYHCTYCNKKFTTNDDLKVHTRTHTGERPYHCIHCGRFFVQSNHLTLHIQRLHGKANSKVTTTTTSQQLKDGKAVVSTTHMFNDTGTDTGTGTGTGTTRVSQLTSSNGSAAIVTVRRLPHAVLTTIKQDTQPAATFIDIPQKSGLDLLAEVAEWVSKPGNNSQA